MVMTNLKEKLEQFRKLDAGKTKGAWLQSHRPTPPDGLYNTQIYDANGETIATLEWCGEYKGNGVTTSLRGNNAEFIAYAANNALPALEQAMAEIERLTVKATLFGKMRDLCGYLQDASDTTVSISQDDATKGWILKVGKQTFRADYLEDAINEAHEKECSL